MLEESDMALLGQSLEAMELLGVLAVVSSVKNVKLELELMMFNKYLYLAFFTL